MPHLSEKPHDQLLADLRAELASSQAALQAAQNDLLDSQEKLNDALRHLEVRRLELDLAHADAAGLREDLTASQAILQALRPNWRRRWRRCDRPKRNWNLPATN